eukprot:GFYU01000751.1.p1 GENE.GFYU01000751.1~~GFYU01000751.1.p1  ORF type:complete len:350 (+),score=114.14 GFYU01000751.1:59-1108(+)
MSFPTVSKTVVFIDAFEGVPGPEHFRIEEKPAPKVEDLADGDIIVEVKAISADPYLRGRLRSSSTDPRKAGSPMDGFVSGKVIASKTDAWAVGDLFGAALPFTTVQHIPAAHLSKVLIWKLTGIVEESNISHGIGILGMPGSTAYGGLIDILRPEEGQTIWVSAASGAVGSLVGQIAKKIYKCKVIGTAGGEEKCKILKEKFGFDVAIDYRKYSTAESLAAAVKEHAPKGIDMYFENVGGISFDAAFSILGHGGRIAVCGGISQYNEKESVKNSINPLQMIYTAQRVEGFVCHPWLTGKKGNFLKDMAKWYADGTFVVEETFFDGVENWPNAFTALFTGANVGKVVVKV